MQQEITLKNLDNDTNNEITPEMVFGDGPNSHAEIDVSSLRSLLDKETPISDFIKENAIGIPFSEEMFYAGKELLHGGLSVIPVGIDKRPLISWKEFQERLATEEEFENWLKTFPNMQLGVVTGKISKLIVVDIDKVGLDVSWLPDTTIVKTGSGGLHYYYSYVPGISNSTRIREFIDIRADGGYVIVPPSKNLKGKYEWKKKIVLAVFPSELFQPEKLPETNAPGIPAAPVHTVYPGYGEGQRNSEMAKYIGSVLTKIHPNEWDNIAYPLIENANRKNTPPLPDYELRNTFQSICGRERLDNSSRWYNKQAIPTPAKVEINLAVKQDYTKRYTWGTKALDNNLAIIKRGNFIIVGAKQSQGKTVFTFDMACKNALLGHKVLYLSLEMDEDILMDDISRKYAGITIPEEYNYNIPLEKTQSYLRKQAEIKSIENLFFKSLRRGDSPRWETIANIIGSYNELDLIFIDNLDLIDGEAGEDNTERQKRITKKIMGFTSEYKIPIILIHHHRKSGGKDYGADELTGSGKIKDNADIILKINRVEKLEEANYPEKYMSWIHQQKGRGYAESKQTVFFINGTFEDTYPPVGPFGETEPGVDPLPERKKMVYGGAYN